MSRTVKLLDFTKKWVSNGQAALHWMDREDLIHLFIWLIAASERLLLAERGRSELLSVRCYYGNNGVSIGAPGQHL